jgi:PAS domain S-box-containing protein
MKCHITFSDMKQLPGNLHNQFHHEPIEFLSNGSNHHKAIDRNISSLFLMARTIISKVEEIDEEKKKRILVVDDEPLVFELIEEFLRTANLNVEILTAPTGHRGLHTALTTVPDLIITDWLMPEVNGMELIKLLKANSITRDIPVIMITGALAPAEEFDNVLRSGAMDFLRKPLDYSEVRALVKAGLALSRSLKEARQQKDLNNQFVNLIFDETPCAIFYQDKSGRFLGCNRNFEILTGTNKQEIIGRFPHEFLAPQIADSLETHRLSVDDCGTVCKFEMDMNPGHYQVSYAGCRHGTMEIVVGSIADITTFAQSGKESLNQLERIHEIEKEVQTRKVEKLKAELNVRQRELAVNLELLIHSQNVMQRLIGEANKLQPYLTLEGRSKLNSLRKHFLWELSQESGLTIEKKFDEANTALYGALERICPAITKNEKRLCAYLKMNHCAADIAKITDKSLNSVHVGFARLRAKLNLPNTKDLRTYLYELSSATP